MENKAMFETTNQILLWVKCAFLLGFICPVGSLLRYLGDALGVVFTGFSQGTGPQSWPVTLW